MSAYNLRDAFFVIVLVLARRCKGWHNTNAGAARCNCPLHSCQLGVTPCSTCGERCDCRADSTRCSNNVVDRWLTTCCNNTKSKQPTACRPVWAPRLVTFVWPDGRHGGTYAQKRCPTTTKRIVSHRHDTWNENSVTEQFWEWRLHDGSWAENA